MPAPGLPEWEGALKWQVKPAPPAPTCPDPGAAHRQNGSTGKIARQEQPVDVDDRRHVHTKLVNGLSR